MIAGLSARLRKLEAIAVHRQTRVIVINSGPGGKERAEREIAALEAAGCALVATLLRNFASYSAVAKLSDGLHSHRKGVYTRL
jgi:hypothetical protein